MARAVQLTVALENKVGALAKLAKALQRVKANIEAISVADNVDVAAVRVVTSSSGKALAALKKAGMAVCTQPVVTAMLEDRPGALAGAAAKLAAAKVNIRYVYGSTGTGQGKALIVFAVDDPAKAAKVLG